MILPTLVALSLLAPAPASSLPLQKESLTLTFGPARVSQVVAKIAEATGAKLEVSPSMASPVVFLSVAERPLDEVLQRIAKVTSGEWSQDGEARRLVRNAAQQGREVQAEYQIRLAAVRKAVQQLVKTANQAANRAQEESSEGVDAEMFGFMFGMSNRVFADLLPLIDANHLTQAIGGNRVVFSSSPNRMQRPLPRNIGPIVDRLVASHNARAAKAPPRETAVEDDEGAAALQGLLGLFGGSRREKPITEPPAKALLVAESPQMSFGINLAFRLYGPSGEVLLEESTVLAGEGLGRMPGFGGMMVSASTDVVEPEGETKPQSDQPPAPKEDPIKFDEISTSVLKTFGSMGAAPNFEPAVDEWLSRPDLNDPLRIVHASALPAVAQAKKRSVVANLPDTASGLSMLTGLSQDLTPSSYLKLLRDSMECEVAETEGWLEVRPKFAEAARNERSDRLALTRLIAASKANAGARLADIAQYALTSPAPMENQVAMLHLVRFAPQTLNSGMRMPDWNMLRLYGMLPPGILANLTQGGTLRFSQLTPGISAQTSKILFGPGTKLTVDRGQAAPPSALSFFSMMEDFAPSNHQDFRDEPTEVMPNGLPPAGALALDASESIIGSPAGGNWPPGFDFALGADELALFRWFSEDPNFASMSGGMPTMDGLRLGSRSTLKFNFHVAPRVRAEKTLNDDRVPKDAPLTPLSQLPPGLSKLIDEKVAELKKTMPNFGNMGRGNPPPPR